MTDFQSIFGLTTEQTRILLSLERYLASKDAENTKDFTKKIVKNEWINEWTTSVGLMLNPNSTTAPQTEEKKIPSLYDNEDDLVRAFKRELSSGGNHTWYHLIILEAITFEAYIPMALDKGKDKAYKKLSYHRKLDVIKNLVNQIGVGSPDMVSRYDRAYDKALDKATGRTQKLIRNGLLVVAVGAITAASAGAFAGPIAVALAGGQFVGLKGAALVNASLALLGGGAIATGGAGMAGGVMAIVGGGALLGAAGGGATLLGATVIAKTGPDLAISQGAKLTVVLREIILNGQKDIILAQNVLERFKAQIIAMQTEISELKLAVKQDKKAIHNLQMALVALEKLYRDGNIFTSSFEIGLETENE